MLGRELLPTEITNLFEEAYHLKRNPRFSLVDYEIKADRSETPLPPQDGRTASSRNLRRIFNGVIEIDGQEHKIQGSGTGALSSLADALRSLGIDLDVVDYNEHTIGTSKDAKAATYIGCTAAQSSQKVWGVGIHQDVVQASLIAMLSAASSVSLTQTSCKALRLTQHSSFHQDLPHPSPSAPSDPTHSISRAQHRAPRGAIWLTN